jgi:hypothetical protein
MKRPNPNQIWIWVNLEAPTYTYGQRKTSYDTNLINWTFTYRRDADIFCPYSYIYPKNAVPPSLLQIEKAMMEPEQLKESQAQFVIPTIEEFSKRKMAVWVVSHCQTDSRREKLVSELEKYIPIDTYGSCGGHSKNCTVSRKKSSFFQDCHPDVGTNYKFYLSFENALCIDYVTEKFFKVLKTGMIPVVYGGADYRAMFPPNSYINVLDFPSIQGLAEYLQDLSSKPDEWRKYFEWRKDYWVMQTSPFLNGYCQICERMIAQVEHKTPRQSALSLHHYGNMYDYWVHGSDKITQENKNDRSSLQCKSNEEVDEMLKRFFQ